jgi:hypothetical protein
MFAVLHMLPQVPEVPALPRWSMGEDGIQQYGPFNLDRLIHILLLSRVLALPELLPAQLIGAVLALVQTVLAHADTRLQTASSSVVSCISPCSFRWVPNCYRDQKRAPARVPAVQKAGADHP